MRGRERVQGMTAVMAGNKNARSLHPLITAPHRQTLIDTSLPDFVAEVKIPVRYLSRFRLACEIDSQPGLKSSHLVFKVI